MPDSCPMAHLIKQQTSNFSQNVDNEKAVKHCSFATAKTIIQAFKPRALRKTMAHRVNGRVLWFNVNKGYGFIHCDRYGNDIFVHNSNIFKNNPNKLIIPLAQGEVVQFDIVMSIKNKPQAVNVTEPKFRPVQGF